MRCVERALVLLALALALAGCGGGGNSVETRCVGNCEGVTPGVAGPEVAITEPGGSNTTEIVVDNGPAQGFSLGVTNLPYVTVTVCAPGSTTACKTLDHVFLDTGSIGLRVLRSEVAALNLPVKTQGGATVAECFPFVVGAVWGPLARADVAIAGERALDIPVQLIDDGDVQQPAVPADCVAAANGELLKSIGMLQAKAVLGIGMLRYDCGLMCATGDYTGSVTLYHRCDAAGCRGTAVPADEQVQNPVVHFRDNNNGTLIVLPALPATGASLVRGRLVFGIGTQTNNQIPLTSTVLRVQTDPAAADYLYLHTRVGSTDYPFSYVDSGSNGLFFDDASLPTRCVAGGAGSTWYCPASAASKTAVLSDPFGTSSSVNFSIASADLLFATPNVAFGNLGGAAGAANAGAFVWGLPFFFGRGVFTSIWGQTLADNGPWVAF